MLEGVPYYLLGSDFLTYLGMILSGIFYGSSIMTFLYYLLLIKFIYSRGIALLYLIIELSTSNSGFCVFQRVCLIIWDF